MLDWLWWGVLRLMLVAVAGIAAASVLWILCEPVVLARRIPRRQVEDLADAVMREHPDDPVEWAFMEEHSAWHRGRRRERALWRQVRREIRRRLPEETPPRPQRP